MWTRDRLLVAGIIAVGAFGVSCGTGVGEAPVAPTAATQGANASRDAGAAAPAATNSPPNLIVNTTPALGTDGKIAAGRPPAPMKVNMCRTTDPDEGDTLTRFTVNWGDGTETSQHGPGAGVSPEDNTGDTGCDRESCCRHYHTYLDRGIWQLTASVSDGHLEDESRGVSSMAMVETTFKVDTEHSTSNFASLTSPEQSAWATVMDWAGVSTGP